MKRVGSTIAVLLLSLDVCTGFTTTKKNNGRSSSSLTSSTLYNSPKGRGSQCYANDGSSTIERRGVLNKIFRGSMTTVAAAIVVTTNIHAPEAIALDFDAFESGEITKDSTSLMPKLNDDEALCKYGAPGRAMGEACERAKMKRKLPGDVDPTGKVNRGDYLKCKYEYPIINGEYVKTRVCKPSGEWSAS